MSKTPEERKKGSVEWSSYFSYAKMRGILSVALLGSMIFAVVFATTTGTSGSGISGISSSEASKMEIEVDGENIKREPRVTGFPEDIVEETIQSPIAVLERSDIVPQEEEEEQVKEVQEEASVNNFPDFVDRSDNTTDILASGTAFSQKFLLDHGLHQPSPKYGEYGPAKPFENPFAHLHQKKESLHSFHRNPYDHLKVDAIPQDYGKVEKPHPHLHLFHHKEYAADPKLELQHAKLGLHEAKQGLHHEKLGVLRGIQGHIEHFKPYHYDPHKIPECVHKDPHLNFCLEDYDYPKETISHAIKKAGHLAHTLFSDVVDQSADNLVDGLSKYEEEKYTYKHYFGDKGESDKYKPPYSGYSYSPDYFKHGGYVCPSNIFYAKPKRAQNSYGKWKIIVNMDYEHVGYGKGHDLHKLLGHLIGHYPKEKQFTQTLRLEKCIYPTAPCSYIDPNIHSSCLQKHNFVRLVAWTAEKGLHIDTFKLPIACSCHIKEVKHVFTAHHQSPLHGFHELHHKPQSHSYIHGPIHHKK